MGVAPPAHRLGAAGILGLSLAAMVGAQSDWVPVGTSTAPAPRAEHALADDPVRGAVVLFGGRAADGTVLGDTWVLDAAGWNPRTAPGAPPPRRGAVLTFHPGAGGAVLFGGYDAAGAPLGDTWLWNGAAWSAVGAAGGPAPRAAAALALDPGTGDLVLFGGIDGSGVALGDTWRFDGAGWSRAAGSGPGPRFGHALAAEPGGGVLLFGGSGTAPATWVLRGATWSLLNPAVDPGPRAHHGMTLDPLRARLVLHGGTDGVAYGLDDTWEWDGQAWDLRTPAQTPPPRIGAALAFAPGRGRTLLFGGFDGAAARDDAWSFGPDVPARVATFGAACAGSAGTPRWQTPAGLPWLGDVLQLRAEGLPPTGAALWHFGFSDSAWAGRSLPLPLGAVGMPGCAVLCSVDVIGPAANVGGVAAVPFGIPTDPTVRGLEVYAQVLALDPGANALGAVTSDALALTVGAR